MVEKALKTHKSKTLGFRYLSQHCLYMSPAHCISQKHDENRSGRAQQMLQTDAEHVQ